jgi:hypothetical protein
MKWSKLIAGFLSFEGWLRETEASSLKDERIFS